MLQLLFRNKEVAERFIELCDDKKIPVTAKTQDDKWVATAQVDGKDKRELVSNWAQIACDLVSA